MRLLLSQGMTLVGAGIGLGIVGALVLTRLLQDYLYGVRPTDPAAIITTALLLGAVAILACGIPARRATEVDPVVALKARIDVLRMD